MSTSRFIQRFGDKITGVLGGFDRLVLRGWLLAIVPVEGMKRVLWLKNILLKDFGRWAERMTAQLKEASLKAVRDQQRPIVYLPSASTDKEEVARKIATKDGITTGLVGVLTCLEPCNSFEIHRNPQTHKLELVGRMRKGLVLYHYWIDPQFGWMNARIQSWLPFSIQVCLNGREWLAQMLDENGIGYRRQDNCFTAIDDIAKAHRLMNRQLRISWPKALHRIPRDFKVLRKKHGESKGKASWRPLRRGVADVHRRAQVSQAANERYLEALAATDTSTPLGELIRDISKPTTYRNKPVRALHPWADPDLALLRAINRGEFSINGFRNRDLRSLLFDHAADSNEEKRQRSARVSRLLRMLRAHHLIQKVPHTHRYVLTSRGREIVSAVVASQQITLEQLNKLAA